MFHRSSIGSIGAPHGSPSSEKVPLKRARKGDLVVPGELLPGATGPLLAALKCQLCSSYVPAMNGDYLVDLAKGVCLYAILVELAFWKELAAGIKSDGSRCKCHDHTTTPPHHHTTQFIPTDPLPRLHPHVARHQVWQWSSIALSLFIAPRRLQKLWTATAKRWIHWLLLLFYQPFLLILENGISSQQSSKPQGILPFSQHRPGKKSSIYSPSPTYCEGSRTEAADHLSGWRQNLPMISCKKGHSWTPSDVSSSKKPHENVFFRTPAFQTCF